MTWFEKLRVVVISALAVWVGLWGIRDLGPEVYRLLFTAPLNCSVADLVKESSGVEVKVTGIIAADRILQEQTNFRRTGEYWLTHYYYPFFNQERTTGFYIYSNLAPTDFLRQYGQGQVTLHGIWEEMPKDVRLQEPMSRQYDQTIYLQQHLKSRDIDSVIKAINDFHQLDPLVIGSRLSLHPLRYKFSQTFMLLCTTMFLVFGAAALWMVARDTLADFKK